MVYVYDLLVNLNDKMYDFYDWNNSDSFCHIRKTPLFKVNDSTFYDLCTKKVRVNLPNIKDKTQVFKSKNIEIIQYACVFTNGKNAVMVEFDNKGYSIKKSKFLVNEELEIVNISSNMKLTNIEYNVINKNIFKNKMLRSENDLLNSILEDLDKIKEDKDKINYLYYEWFNSGEVNYDKLVRSLKNNFTDKHKEFLELINLLMIKK